MGIKINREIRDYTEAIFFGLSMRQFFFSLIGATVAIVMYFIPKNFGAGTETISWVCMLGGTVYCYGVYSYLPLFYDAWSLFYRKRAVAHAFFNAFATACFIIFPIMKYHLCMILTLFLEINGGTGAFL